MKKIQPVKFFVLLFIIGLLIVDKAAAQTEPETPKRVNFGYSKNPKTKAKSVTTESGDKTEVVQPAENKISETNPQKLATENNEFESRSVANKTLEVVKRANKNAVSPTEIYKVGVGDVLFISLQNAPAKDSTYYTVLNDGTIDYPLAGEMVSISGLTTDEIEDLLKEKIKLYENPQISVKVREHASHAIRVLGLVEKAGEIYLRREAEPLFTIRAEAIVHPRADSVIIKRANSETEQIDLRDTKSQDVLIFPGDILEFKSTETGDTNSSGKQFYFIGGNIVSAGQKEFHQGLTLTQAILASQGLKKESSRKVVIRRLNQDGFLMPLEFNLNDIKGGKQPDPQIKAGDTIEIVN